METLETKLNFFKRATLKFSPVLLALTLSYSACGKEPAPPDGGCTSNSQCRTPRVCEEGECVYSSSSDSGSDQGTDYQQEQGCSCDTEPSACNAIPYPGYPGAVTTCDCDPLCYSSDYLCIIDSYCDPVCCVGSSYDPDCPDC